LVSASVGDPLLLGFRRGLALQRLWLREVVTPLRITTLNAFGIGTDADAKN
jgi:hypothetical protein